MALGPRLGIEIGGNQIRAVRVGGLGRRRAEAVEVELHQESVAGAVEAIEQRLGTARALTISIAVEALFVKRTKLPPLALSDRRRMVALEPERFFPVRGEDLAVGVRAEDDLVFATRAGQMREWLESVERLGTVEWVEPAPASLARACARAGLAGATIICTASDGRGFAIVEVADGRVCGLRKVFGGVAEAAAALEPVEPRTVLYLTPWADQDAGILATAVPGVEVRPLPSIAGLAPAFSTAYGAALGEGANGDTGLMPVELARRVETRKRRRIAAAVVAAVVAAGFTVGSLDHYRARTTDRLASEIAAYRERAVTVLDLQAEADALSRASNRLADVEAQRSNPLLVLQTITRLLPADASIRALRNNGDEWELDGLAQDAARLIPVFEESPEFEGVRFRTATSRIRLGDQTYEDYSLVLRYAPAP